MEVLIVQPNSAHPINCRMENILFEINFYLPLNKKLSNYSEQIYTYRYYYFTMDLCRQISHILG